MIGSIIKIGFYFLIILILFAILPKSVFDNLKKFFNWENFVKILKTGFNNFINFIKEIFSIDLSVWWLKIKTFYQRIF